MKRPQWFGSRVARRLFLSYTIPLLVLMVAGLLVPLFVWTWLDGYRIAFENENELSQRSVALRSSGIELEEARSAFLKSATAAQRRRLQQARDDYRNSGIRFREWLEMHPDNERRRLYRAADLQVRLWLRDPSPLPTIWEPARQGLDRLARTSSNRMDEKREDFRQMDTLRRTAVVLIPFLAVVLSLVIGRSVAIGLTSPLVELTGAAVRIREGGSGEELDPFSDPEDEIGDLRRAFRTMSDAIVRRETELNARNAALAAVGRRLEAVLNATDEGIAMLDRHGRFSVVNDRFGTLMQVSPNTLLASHIAVVAPRLIARFRDPAAARRELRRIVRSPDITWAQSFSMAGERTQVLRIFTAPVRAPGASDDIDSLLGRIVVLRDITRESEVDRMKTEFVSTVSHELRTPLTAIQGYVDLILRGQTGPLTATQEEFLRLTSENTERLTALINDILDISRIEQGGTALRRVPVPLTPVVRRVVQLLEGQAAERRIALSASVPEHDLVVEGDRDRLVQVLNNLVSNALKYTPAGGSVAVEVRHEGNQVAIDVVDTGIGIGGDDLEHIFDRFYRADNSTTRSSGGTGLGLAISKSLVERMGGTIGCQSKIGAGSTFTFTLPLSEMRTEEADHDDNTPAQLILLVEPRSEVRSQLANYLRRSGFALSPAGNDAEAWRRARGLRPDLVLLQACHDNIDGPGLAAKMSADPATSHIPICLTGILDRAYLINDNDTVPQEIRDALAEPDGSFLVFGNTIHAAHWLGDPGNRFVVDNPARTETSSNGPLPLWCIVEFEKQALIRVGKWLSDHPEHSPRIVLYGNIPNTVHPLGRPGREPVALAAHARRVSEQLREARRRESSNRQEAPDA